MGRYKWIVFVASRYVSKARRNSPSSALAVIGIATGVLALTVILAVMNGLQLGFIESILEISSYHIRAEVPFTESDTEAEQDSRIFEAIPAITEVPGVTAAVPFREFHGLIQGDRGGQQVAVIRGLPSDALEKDQGLARKLIFESGSFALAGERGILLGAELAKRLYARVGDEITVVSIAGLLNDAGEPADSQFTVTGIFRSDFYEYDLGWGFINLRAAGELGGGAPLLGVKIKNRWQDRAVLTRIRNLPETQGLKLSTWRDYNRSFFGALRTEKLLMFLLVGLIFIVVGLNIFQSQRRIVLERREDIGLFRAMGAGEQAVRLVFVWDGFVIGLTGGGGGLILGLLLGTHINKIIALWNYLIDSIFNIQKLAIFPQGVFYIREIPSRIIPHEVCLIFFFGFFSAILSSWFASGKASRTRPAEVLRYE
ncbi:MAG: ABC transporter permease [Spirochaetaceae bacterium]|jgi:lipoprotein-releasing system permease protein|nr:ABC transporter permease [Spirochaetaceae bacterium]